ncbi:hypothetical protein ACPSKX_17795 [Moritella viscosa]
MKHQPARILSPVAFAIICALSSSAFAEQSSRDNTEEQMTVFGKAYRNTATTNGSSADRYTPSDY